MRGGRQEEGEGEGRQEEEKTGGGGDRRRERGRRGRQEEGEEETGEEEGRGGVLTCESVQYLPDELRVEVVRQPCLNVLDVVLQSGDLTGRRRRGRCGAGKR